MQLEIDEINKLGYRINNLFENDDGTWRCNVRRSVGEKEEYFDFVDAATAQEALLRMLAHLRTNPTGVPQYKYRERDAYFEAVTVKNNALRKITLDML